MSRGRFVRRSLLTSLATVAALLVVPSGAGAATTIGETFTPTTPCLTNQTLLQTTSPGAQYAAPSAGVITRWSFQASAANVPTGLKFKVARPAGGNNFTVVGESTQVPPVASTLNNYFVQIPVQAGDLIGFYVVSPGDNRLCGTNLGAGAPYAVHLIFGDVSPGTTAAFGQQVGPKLDVSALLESDCDNDGLGDETQDTNLSACAPGTTPPPATGPPPTLPSGAPATCRGVQATIVGTNGSDARTGSQGQDVIVALGGNDTLSGVGGNDVICGGAGKDSLRGGKGKDSLLGQKGKDGLNGGPSRDFCKGGKGTDTASKCEVEKSI
jgi:Ca2+-binding RTX toxin-like protein